MNTEFRLRKGLLYLGNNSRDHRQRVIFFKFWLMHFFDFLRDIILSLGFAFLLLEIKQR